MEDLIIPIIKLESSIWYQEHTTNAIICDDWIRKHIKEYPLYTIANLIVRGSLNGLVIFRRVKSSIFHNFDDEQIYYDNPLFLIFESLIMKHFGLHHNDMISANILLEV